MMAQLIMDHGVPGGFVTSLAPSTTCFSHGFVAGSILPTEPLYD